MTPAGDRGWTVCGRLAGVLALLGMVTACEAQESGLDEERLGVMIDSLLPEIVEASGLELRQPVQFSMQSTAEVRAFIEEEMEAELAPGEFEGMERAYKAFGLLPASLDLPSLLLDLYTEQVVGYYDPRRDRLYVIEGVEGEAAAPVVAHELVHALQDQHVDLEGLMAPEHGNDRQLAAQAAAEGQATLVMIMLQTQATMGQPVDPAALPDLAELLRPAMEAENASFPVFRDAPRLIRETMLFPYLGGAAFMQALHRATANGPPVPFDEYLPHSTEQVMDPAGRFLGTRDRPTEVRLEDPPSGWRVVYENTLGQLEVSVLLTEHLGAGSAAAAEGWDGDRYVLLEAGEGERDVLVWYSVWDDEMSAERFVDAYRRGLDGRPERSGSVERTEVEGRPVVRVVEGEAGFGLEEALWPGVRSLTEGGDG